MSPPRTRQRQQFVPSRPRAEVITAVAVAVAIVAGTLLLIWLMRPGKVGVPGGGGLLSRQSRMTILLVLTAAALLGVFFWVRSGRRRPKRLGQRGAIIAGSAVVIVLAILGGIFWPGGVVRHWPNQPKIANTPATNPISVPSTTPATAAPSTTAKTGTTVKPATSSSTPPTTKGR
jgi:magnesium-transporting ATPase (P-type)